MGHMLLHNVGRWNLGYHDNVTNAWVGWELPGDSTD